MYPIKLLSYLVLFFISYSSLAENFYPQNILMMDEKFTHHILLVEKSTHKLYLYANDHGVPRLVTSYVTVTGKNSGNKKVEGDDKTPEGFYQLTKFFPMDYLLKTYGDYGKIYGAGAFVLNYPNVIDRLSNKTGNGIWLHSTDDESRISKGFDTRGCVVVANNDLKEISRYIDLDTKTPIIITETVNFWSETTWQKNRDQLGNTIKNWIAAWNKTDLNQYLSFYDRSLFKDESGKNYSAWANHKERVFKTAKDTSIKMDYIYFYLHNDYAFVGMQQNYYSSLVKDTGKKIMIWKKDSEYNWKIVHEGWESMAAISQLAFTPSQRFFR